MTAADDPLVSIIIPSFNRGHVVERAVQSALRQTYPHTEIVVVDDGSTDDTARRLERIRSAKLKVLSNRQNLGPANARNLGIACSTGPYVAFLDSDDTWEPWKLEAQLARFRQGPADLGAVYCGWTVRLDGGGDLKFRPCLRGNVYEALLRRNRVPLPAIMVKRTVLEYVGAFDAGLPACEDWDLVLRIARTYEFDFVADTALRCDGTGCDRLSGRARAVFIANHRIFRRFNGHRPSRETLAAHLALQSRELLNLGRFKPAARYAFGSLRLGFNDEERLALRTLRRLMMRRPLGRVLVQVYAWRRSLTWRSTT